MLKKSMQTLSNYKLLDTTPTVQNKIYCKPLTVTTNPTNTNPTQIIWNLCLLVTIMIK